MHTHTHNATQRSAPHRTAPHRSATRRGAARRGAAQRSAAQRNATQRARTEEKEREQLFWTWRIAWIASFCLRVSFGRSSLGPTSLCLQPPQRYLRSTGSDSPVSGGKEPGGLHADFSGQGLCPPESQVSQGIVTVRGKADSAVGAGSKSNTVADMYVYGCLAAFPQPGAPQA